MLVAATTTAASRDDQRIPFVRKIIDQLTRRRVANDSSWRHPQFDVCAVLAVSLVLRSIPTSDGCVRPLIAKRAEAVDCWIGDEDDITTTAAVPTVGTASGDELLAMEADEPMPTVPRPDSDVCTIDQTGSRSSGRISVIIWWWEAWEAWV